MKYKFEYEDENQQKHIRYCNARDGDTGTTVVDGRGGGGGGEKNTLKEEIQIIDILKRKEGEWEHVSIPKS